MKTFSNSGQVCVSPNRCFVHEAVYDEFVQYVKKQTEEVTMGPLISEQEHARVLGLVDQSIPEGAEVCCGGKSIAGPGFFMDPTVLSGVTIDMAIANTEIFGPVLPIIKYSDSDDEIALANGVEF